MARNQVTVPISDDGWTELTDGDATEVTFQVIVGDAFIRFGDATAPDETPGEAAQGRLYYTHEGEANQPMAALALAITATRVWAKAKNGSASVLIDHA